MFIRSSLYFRRMFKEEFLERQKKFADRIYGGAGITILHGPFAGLRYINETVWGPIEPKWIGSYEAELNHVVSELLIKRYHSIIDIGSAEGYYTVGLASKKPDASVYSYEVDPWSRRQQKRLAALNGVTNLKISGFCNHREIQRNSKGLSLLICDTEGYEMEILDPKKCSRLMSVDILVELHAFGEFTMFEVKERIIERFLSTHRIEKISSRKRSPELYGGIDEIYLDERRNEGQQWLWMRAVANG